LKANAKQIKLMETLQFEIAFYNISFGLKNRVKFVSHTAELFYH
jgi:hypothetical protein